MMIKSPQQLQLRRGRDTISTATTLTCAYCPQRSSDGHDSVFHDEYKTENFKACLGNLKYFAGPQIRNVATIAGNLVTASARQRGIPKDLHAGILYGLPPTRSPTLGNCREYLPFSKRGGYTLAFNHSKRKHDDIAIVNACLRVVLDENGVIKDAVFGFDGLSAFTRIALDASKSVVGRKWEDGVLDGAGETAVTPHVLSDQFHSRRTGGLPPTAGSSVHAQVLPLRINKLDKTKLKSGENDNRPINGAEKALEGAVGTSIPHLAALKQVTGEAVYLDDIPVMGNEAYAAMVLSSEGNAAISSVDPSEALEMEGVIGYISAEDVSGYNADDPHNGNIIGPIIHDEEIFATERVYYVNQMIGLIIAKTEILARRAARKVKVTYADKQPLVVTIEDAIETNSFFEVERTIRTGHYDPAKREADVPLSDATHSVTGVARMSAQEHFYLETQACLLVHKKEDNKLEIFSSTQNPTETQVASAVDSAGKETRRNLSCALAVAAHKLKIPVRLMYTREVDMAVSGQRHPFRGDYKLVYLEVEIVAIAGFSRDLSSSVLECAMTHVDNCYKIPNAKVVGKLAKTNLPSNTAFRSFGGAQGMMITEQFITHVAEYLGSPWRKSAANIPSCPPNSDSPSPRASSIKRAPSFTFTRTDPSSSPTAERKWVKAGLHTKMVQVAAHALGIPVSKVHLFETQTSTVPNTSATAASVSSDLNGMAVLNACEKLHERLKPFRESTKTWEEAVNKAYFERTGLSATGFYKTPNLNFDWDKLKGRMFNYFTLDVDTLTGDHTTLRADIAMDIGQARSCRNGLDNPRRAPLQPQNWIPRFLITRGPGAYKIPGFRDIPVDFRVNFLAGLANMRAIHSSKAVGEPPLLGCTIIYTIREAFKSARAQHGDKQEWLRMDSPVTGERILEACGGKDARKAKEFKDDGKAWGVVA
ncbi:molybdopterin binding aldehyde oxidase/xanthine dehydrogenase [Powellomyces hirtus]|nr:molybdopterin binding aldehyde oxidase/xanthine dehydrogenase [Powellomyces hirtus]